MAKNINLAIVGAGIAGISSAVYAKRAGLEFSFFESAGVGGQILYIEDIDNYVGLEAGSKGKDLAARLAKTISDLEIDIIREKIVKVEIAGDKLNIYSPQSHYAAAGLIVAAGASFRNLGVEGEESFLGRGVSYCAVCDGFFFRGKDVGVVGGGNTAVEEALYLAEIARRVYLIHRRDKLRALDYLQDKLARKKNIEVILDSTVNAIKGKDLVEAVVVENIATKQQSRLSLSGVFIAVGIKPNTDPLRGSVAMDDNGFILTDEAMKSSCDFIWAAGDCRQRPLRQLITAAAEGAVAALSAYKYLKGYYISS